MNGRTLVALPFDQVVRNVFNPMGSQTNAVFQAASLMTIWASYMLTARSIEEVFGYLGHLEFAIEACKQNLPPQEDTIHLEPNDPCGSHTVSTVFVAMSAEAGDLQSFALSAWMDGEVTPQLNAGMRMQMARLDLMMGRIRELHGVRRSDILHNHVAVIGKDHPHLVYAEVPQAESRVTH